MVSQQKVLPAEQDVEQSGHCFCFAPRQLNQMRESSFSLLELEHQQWAVLVAEAWEEGRGQVTPPPESEREGEGERERERERERESE